MPLITTPTPDRAFGSRPGGGSTGARSHITQPALVKIVGSEELPTAVHVDASPAATRSSAASEPSPNDLAAPTPVGPPPTAPVPSVVAVNKIADSGPGVSQSLRTMSAAPEATAAPSAVQASVAAPPDAPQQPAEVAPTVESKVVVPSAQPDLVRPTKLSRKTPVRAMVAKTAATAPSLATEMRRQPQRPGASMIPSAPAAPQTTAASATGQESVNPVTHVFAALAGALGAPTVDQTASKSGDWAIQFAAPKSEAEAKVTAARLNAKYAPALNGATIVSPP